MTIQQFQYVLAVVDSKNFELAAEKCFVTQSTLSTMINKFEGEIGVKIFNRKTKPVTVTKEGQQIIDRLRIVISEVDILKNVVQEIKGEMVGELKIGIIPTVAPHLLPLFIEQFSERFPKVDILVREMTTPQIQQALMKRSLDIGILALPLDNKELLEVPLYDEPFLVYDCTENFPQDEVCAEDLDYSKMCLLEEGHCLRTQVYEICQLSEQYADSNVNYRFESGSLESLIRITEARKGITILPHLTYLSLDEHAQSKTVQFQEPVPIRSIGLVTHQFFAKKALREGLQEVILNSVKGLLPEGVASEMIRPV